MQTSVTTNKPIRLDFDRDVTVVLKLDKDGKVQAHFIPGTAEVESYLRNNIQCLKQRFDDENINPQVGVVHQGGGLQAAGGLNLL